MNPLTGKAAQLTITPKRIGEREELAARNPGQGRTDSVTFPLWFPSPTDSCGRTSIPHHSTCGVSAEPHSGQVEH